MRRLWLLLVPVALAGLVYFASGSTRVFVEYPDGGVTPLQQRRDGFWALPGEDAGLAVIRCVASPTDRLYFGPTLAAGYRLCLDGVTCAQFVVKQADGGWELHR
jgi:hypothetical protein